MKKGISLILLPVLLLTGGVAVADGWDERRDDWRKYYDAGSVLGGLVFDEASVPLAEAVVTVTRIGVPSFSLSDTSDGARGCPPLPWWATPMPGNPPC